MAVRTKEEILEALSARIGEEPDDDSIKFLEDVTDTIADFESKIGDSEDWKAKYEANDKEWRKKYTERFFSGEPTAEETPVPDVDPEDPEGNHTPMNFEDLFTEEKGE